MPEQPLLDAVRRHVGFDADDAVRLRSLVEVLAPHFVGFAQRFFQRLVDQPDTRAVISGGPAHIDRLERSLVAWMDSGLRGPYDAAFYQHRIRVGRGHVENRLPQHYLVSGIGVVRQDYHGVIELAYADQPARLHACTRAIDRLLDVELAIMLQAYRTEAEEQLQRNERLATLGIVSATIGHDLRNPLGVIESSAFLLRRAVTGERGLQHLERIDVGVHACNRIVKALLELTRASPPALAPIDLQALFAAALAMITVPDAIRVHIEVDATLGLEGDAAMLEQVVVNLVLNAITAIGAGSGNIVLRASRFDNRLAAITVLDDGPGFDPQILRRAFEPLVSGKPTGVGLGLALVKNVALRHHGIATAENPDGGGAIVRLLLPLTPVAEAADA